ncbi:unnamed protein product [Soboliphyme baturini]|uniref:PLCXc domain-containing protein n=1 Tax=Soboliphyme baturini TaxID=241478 RepID=A0A183J672_9BILA|nr:unnamed protein product [Soboliphyme baturini]
MLICGGSHNSFTYALKSKWHVAVDQGRWIRRIDCPWVRKTICRWATCQNIDVMRQLMIGVRFFDVRVAIHHPTSNSTISDDFYAVHGLYGERMIDAFRQIVSFLKAHPDELVILDINHFYNFSISDHARLLHVIASSFDSMLCPSGNNLHLDDVTLDMLRQSHRQAIVFYQAEQRTALDTLNVTWPRRFIVSPWANTNSLTKLFAFLERTLAVRDQLLPEGGVFVVQSILTPHAVDVVLHLRSSLQQRIALNTTEQTVKWLRAGQRESVWPFTAAVVLVDFVNFPDFCRTVVNMNLL